MKLYVHTKNDSEAPFCLNECWVVAVTLAAILLLVIFAAGGFTRPAVGAVAAQVQELVEHYRSIRPMERNH